MPGDVVLLEQGSMVPADVRLLQTNSLQVNESAMTGESVPVAKTDEAVPEAEDALPPADQRNMAFLGTAVTALVLFQKVHVFNCRSEDVSILRKSLLANKVLLLGVTASLIIHIAALHLPWTQQLLSFRGLPATVWGVAIAVAATAIVVNELHKWLRPR